MMTDDTNLPEEEQYYDTLLVEELLPNGQTIWTAIHPDLPGCTATGKTDEDAMANLTVARDSWIDAAQRLDHAIPQASAFLSIQRRFAVRPGVQQTQGVDMETRETIQREIEIGV